jgi:hypothetical protein
VDSPLEAELVETKLDWAWDHPEMEDAVRAAYRLKYEDSVGAAKDAFTNHVTSWLAGLPYVGIADNAGRTMVETLFGRLAQKGKKTGMTSVAVARRRMLRGAPTLKKSPNR